MTAQRQSALLLMLICVFVACSEHDDPPLLEEDIPKELVEDTTIEPPENAEQRDLVEMERPRD